MCFCSFSGTSLNICSTQESAYQNIAEFLLKICKKNNVPQVTELPYFATKVRIGRNGAEEIYQLGPLNEYERYGLLLSMNRRQHSILKGSPPLTYFLISHRAGLEKAKAELSESIQKGISFIKK